MCLRYRRIKLLFFPVFHCLYYQDILGFCRAISWKMNISMMGIQIKSDKNEKP